MDNALKKDIEDLKAVADQLLLQTTMNTVKINIITQMVLGVYRETLDEAIWKNIHRNFYDNLNEEMKDVFRGINDVTFNSINHLKHSFEFQSKISKSLKDLDD